MALLHSATTATELAGRPGAQPGAYATRIEAWRRTLTAQGRHVRTIGDADLERGNVPEPLIVVPSGAALSDAAVAGLEKLVREGHALLATWQLGLYRAAGAWRGYEVLDRLFGLKPIDGEKPPAPRYFSLRAGTAIAAGFPAGMRLEVQPYDGSLNLTAPGGTAEWVAWDLMPLGEQETVRTTAVATARPGKGRAVWFDFEPNAATAASTETMGRLVDNALAWIAGRPLAAADPWPGGARLAVLVGVDTELGFESATLAADALTKAGVRGTFFCVSDLARTQAETLATIARAGEIGSHTDDHKVLAGKPGAEQEQHVRASADALASLGAPRVEGLRPPEEQIDGETLAAVARAGLTYVAGTPYKDRTEPVISPEGLVVLPRIAHDDFHWLAKVKLTEREAVVAAFDHDLSQVERLGGLYILSLHTQMLRDPAVGAALARVLERTARADVWRAEGRAIAAWWRRRAGVAVTAGRDGTRTRVRVSTKDAIRDLTVTVHLRSDDVRADGGVAVERVREPEPAVRLRLPPLGAGEERTVVLSAP